MLCSDIANALLLFGKLMAAGFKYIAYTPTNAFIFAKGGSAVIAVQILRSLKEICQSLGFYNKSVANKLV